MRKFLLTSVVLVGTAAPVWANEISDDLTKVDDARDHCMEASNADDYEMKACQNAAAEGYDAQLNKVYKALMKEIDPTSSKLLLDSQRKWLTARAADQAMWSGSWLANAGSLAVETFAETEADTLRLRVYELNDILMNR